MTHQITAWSFSRYQTYTQCPFKAKCKFILKLPEPPAPAMARGSAIHKLAEDFTNGALKKLPPELKLFGKEFRSLKKAGAKCEESWAFNKAWEPTGWFDRDAWLRVKMDTYNLGDATLDVIDHKTGKPKEDHEEQLSLYGLSGFLQFPDIDEVKASLWYLDFGPEANRSLSFNCDQVEALKKEWTAKTKPMLNDKKFLPKQNFGCKWCPFSKDKGGPCKY